MPLRSAGASNHGEGDQLQTARGSRHLVVDQGLDVFVVDLLFAVGEILEALEGILKRVFAEIVAEFAQLLPEGMAPGVFSHDE